MGSIQVAGATAPPGASASSAHSLCAQGDDKSGLATCESWQDVVLQNQVGTGSLRAMLGQIQALEKE